MKNLFYSMVLGMTMTIPAQAMMNSNLSLGMQDNEKFTLAFDNNFYSTPSNTYSVTNIFPGSHHVRMMSAPTQAGACGLPRLLFDGWVNVPENSIVTAYANEYSQLNVLSVVPLVQQQVYYNPNVNYGNGYCNGNGNNYGNNYGNGWNNSSGYTNNYYGQNNYYPPTYGMNAVDFDALKNSIRSKPFDSDKLLVAEQASASNRLTAQQVSELVQLMDFESSKLALAKSAYGNTVDKNNYYMVSNAFTFSSSITELSNYINNYRV